MEDIRTCVRCRNPLPGAGPQAPVSAGLGEWIRVPSLGIGDDEQLLGPLCGDCVRCVRDGAEPILDDPLDWLRSFVPDDPAEVNCRWWAIAGLIERDALREMIDEAVAILMPTAPNPPDDEGGDSRL